MPFKRTGALLLVICMAVSLPYTALAAQTQPEEYQIKAAFLYNIIQFVEWPADELAAHENMTICIFGKNPFGPFLDSIVGKKAWGKNLLLSRINNPQQAGHCQVVFISPSDKNALPVVLNAVRGLHVLTIGDTEGFSEQGVIINFFMAENNRIRFEINKEASRTAGLKISSHLLKLARITRD